MDTFKTNFLDNDRARQLVAEHGSPMFVYSRGKLLEQAQTMLDLPAPYGLTIRYAMKANPHPEILKLFRDQGIKIDASSAYEADEAIRQGYEPSDILLTSQQMAHNLTELVTAGVQFNATSLHQLEEYGKAFPGTDVSVRINPGVGSGMSAKANVGGPASSFGVWYEYLPQLLELVEKYKLNVIRLHTHIGSGTDPKVWQVAARLSLDLLEHFPAANTLNLGGGFKVRRMDYEKGTDAAEIGTIIAKEVQDFQTRSKRKLHLELEPGNFMTANTGILISNVEDIVDTGTDGYTFLKLNTGMTDILRPNLYGAQHPIAVLSTSSITQQYVVVGHCCESGDLLTPAPGEPETLSTRELSRASIGDIVLIGGAGAYCASMAARGYNGFPAANEILVD